MTENFYRSFEDKFRGSRKEIIERYKIYLQFILPLKEIYPDGEGLDIGCGRGEWLGLLKKNSIVAQGIDIDEGMLKACNENNLNTLKGDGFAHLKTLKDESLTIISAFHIIEHIPFETLQSFVSEAHRVLKPGGLVIIETPNPENIKVGTELFYLDPTHLKPIPSELLSFVVDFYGFERSKVLRLQEDKSLVNQENISLIEVIRGASPDYSIVAQKKADDELLKPFEEQFSLNIGLPLTALSNKFEDRFRMVAAKAEQAEAKAEQAVAKAEQAAVRAEQAQAKAEQFNVLLQSIFSSRSCKLTRPLRWFMFQLRLIKQYGLFLHI
ncbi:class I SAM-dependent methyltransferase, partial [Candidatus Poseidoniaceae archaeon]|nr:class I SAM-dependent methyltransferase [Candidatus Poseidoniaceae archaeon]